MIPVALIILFGPLGAMPLTAWGALTGVLTSNEGRPDETVGIDRTFVEKCRKSGFTTLKLQVTWTITERSATSVLPFGSTITVPELPPGTYDVAVACFYTTGVVEQRAGPDGTVETAEPDGVIEVEFDRSTAIFTVLPPLTATLELTPTAAEPGDTVTATDANYTEERFPAGASVRVDGNEVPLASGPDRGNAGEITVPFTMPDLSPGQVTVELACIDEVSATAELDVSATPPTPTPTSPPTPTATGTGVARTDFVTSVPLPGEVSWSLAAVLVSLTLFTVLFWAMGFPSEPFNKTLEANRERMHAWFVGHGDPRRVVPDGWGAFALYAVVAAVLLTLVEPGTGLDPSSWWAASSLTLGFLIAVPVTKLAYCVPAELHARGTVGEAAALRILPGALLFAGGCIALTRWAHLQPGYVYGLFAFYAVTASPLRERVAGRGILIGSASLLAVSLAAWLAWPPVAADASAAGASYGALVLDAALATVFVLGVQTLVFGLVPLTFLDGAKLKQWSPPAWVMVWGISLALLVHVLFAKFVREVTDPVVAVRAEAPFLAFFGLSACFWLAFRLGGGAPAPGHSRWPHQPTGTDRQPTERNDRPARTGLVVGTAALVLVVTVLRRSSLPVTSGGAKMTTPTLARPWSRLTSTGPSWILDRWCGRGRAPTQS